MNTENTKIPTVGHLHMSLNYVKNLILQFVQGAANDIATLTTDKQDKLIGTPGQVVGFDSDGDATAQDLTLPVTQGFGTISGAHGYGNSWAFDVTLAGFKRIPGSIVSVQVSSAFVSGGIYRFNVNNTGTAEIHYKGSTDVHNGVVASGDMVTVMYDGSVYRIISVLKSSATSSGGGSNEPVV